MGTQPESAEFAAKFNVDFPVVADPERNLYRKFELKQLAASGFFSPRLALKAVAAMADGYGIGMPKGDIRQLPGVFVIDTAGNIVFSHCSSDPADHPDVKTILDVLPQNT